MRVMVQGCSTQLQSVTFLVKFSMFIPEIHKDTYEQHIAVQQIKGMTKTYYSKAMVT